MRFRCRLQLLVKYVSKSVDSWNFFKQLRWLGEKLIYQSTTLIHIDVSTSSKEIIEEEIMRNPKSFDSHWKIFFFWKKMENQFKSLFNSPAQSKFNIFQISISSNITYIHTKLLESNLLFKHVQKIQISYLRTIYISSSSLRTRPSASISSRVDAWIYKRRRLGIQSCPRGNEAAVRGEAFQEALSCSAPAVTRASLTAPLLARVASTTPTLQSASWSADTGKMGSVLLLLLLFSCVLLMALRLDGFVHDAR